MNIEFTREQRITNALMLHSTSIDEIGLSHGKIGVAIYFHHLARQSGKEIFAKFADELIDQVTESLSNDTPFDFESGVTGIGWAVEYLIQNGFVEADSDEILEEFDAKVAQTLINSENNFETLLSIGHYYVARLSYRIEEQELLTVLDLKYNAILFVDELERQIAGQEESKEAAHLLDELLKINVFNYKVEKLRRTMRVEEYDFMMPFLPRLTAEQVVEKLNSPDVKSRFAGYDLSSVPETERWGLKNGIAGIGLQKILCSDGL